MNRKAAVILTMILLVCCAVMTGLSVSTVRAVFMYCLVAGARLSGRTYDPLTGVSLTAAIILIVNPEYLTYSGFQLSFLAVVILGLCSERGPLMRGVILYLGTVPFVLCSWYEIPLYSVAGSRDPGNRMRRCLWRILYSACGRFGESFVFNSEACRKTALCSSRLRAPGADPDLIVRGALCRISFPLSQVADKQKKVLSDRDDPGPSSGVPCAEKG